MDGENTQQFIEDKIKEIIISVADFPLDKASISEEDDGIRNLGLNSLTIIRMMVEIERYFDISIDIEDESVMHSLNKLSQYISTRWAAINSK